MTTLEAFVAFVLGLAALVAGAALNGWLVLVLAVCVP